jgi:uncharacterized protein (DUF362 family)
MISKVAIVKGKRGHDPVFQALDLIDYRSAISGWKTVLIKVNFITVKTWDTGATTDPMVVEAIIKKLRDLSAEVYVVESDASITSADKAFEVTGMREMCQAQRCRMSQSEIPQRKGQNQCTPSRSLKGNHST